MVRAILEGRKTQTRRVSGLEIINKEPHRYEFKSISEFEGVPHAVFHDHISGAQVLVKLKHGKPSDQLWVRETWMPTFSDGPAGRQPFIDFRAGPEIKFPSYGFVPKGKSDMIYSMCGNHKWRPSIFMPRWASRITLEITSIRAERLREISKSDAEAEGIRKFDLNESCGTRALYGVAADEHEFGSTAKEGYEILWESINGPGSWDENPFVWVIEFRKL